MNISQLINDLADEKVSLNQSLLKVKVILHSVGDQELLQWVNHELTGYSKDDEVPQYRICTAQVTATIDNGYKRYTNLSLPLLGLDIEKSDLLKKMSIHYSVAALESVVSDGDSIAVEIPVAYYSFINGGIEASYQIEVAYRTVHSIQLRQVFSQIRSRVLDALLSLQDKFPDQKEIAASAISAKSNEIKGTFDSAIFGDNTTIVIGDNNKQTVNIRQVVQNNFDSLAKFLENNSVEQKDIEALKTAIADDGERKKEDGFGGKVKDWIKCMLGKAVEMSWQVSIGASGNILAGALCKYYGWS